MARTRSEKAHHDVVAAALDVLLEQGVPGFTIDEVVNRSGVAKTTIYRWWPSRQALILDAIHTQLQQSPTPNTGDTRADLLSYLSAVAPLRGSTTAGRLLTELCSIALRDPEFAELRDVLVGEKRQPVRTILELARARGELAPGADLELLTTLIVGPIAYTKSMCGRPVDVATLEQVIDAALRHGATTRAEA